MLIVLTRMRLPCSDFKKNMIFIIYKYITLLYIAICLIKKNNMKTLEISDETFERIKDQLSQDDIEINSYEDFIGIKLFIRTVTYHMVGRVKKIIGGFFELEDASWIADSGRFMNAINEGTLSEIEPVGQWFVQINAATDFGIWKHALPKIQK